MSSGVGAVGSPKIRSLRRRKRAVGFRDGLADSRKIVNLGILTGDRLDDRPWDSVHRRIHVRHREAGIVTSSMCGASRDDTPSRRHSPRHRPRRRTLRRRRPLPARAQRAWRTTGRVFRRRTGGALLLLAVLPAATTLPALAALALVSRVCTLVVAHEAIRYRESRVRVRHLGRSRLGELVALRGKDEQIPPQDLSQNLRLDGLPVADPLERPVCARCRPRDEPRPPP